MTSVRVLALAAGLALAGAGAVAYVSRTPASIRAVERGPDATDPSRGARFTSQEIARHGDYRGPLYLSTAIAALLPVAVLLLLARGPFSSLIERIGSVPGGWPVRAVLAGAALSVVLALVALPLSYVTGFAMSHAWGLSTQDLGGWVSDQVRGALVGIVFSGVAAVAFYGVTRAAPRSWWLWGWAAFTALSAALVFLWPVLVAPLFNRFTSLEPGPLKDRIFALAADAGVDIDDVLVADASKRSTAENAYVAGIGSTKRLVVYDTLLDAGSDDDTLFVIAHELGHKKEGHVGKGILLSAAGLFVGFGVLYLLSRRSGLWAWAGASGVDDIRGLPLLVAFLSLMTLVTAPVANAVSRRFEARADEIAVSLTHDPDVAVKTFRRLAYSNIADLRPPGIAVALLFSHPPIPDRIEAVAAEVEQAP